MKQYGLDNKHNSYSGAGGPGVFGRMIKQIAVNDNIIFALCDDGTLWSRSFGTDDWTQLPPVPVAGVEHYK